MKIFVEDRMNFRWDRSFGLDAYKCLKDRNIVGF